MDRITKSLLDEFSRDYGLHGLPEDVRFEHFASFVTVHRQHSETFDTSAIVLSESGGMGIDAIATIVNGNLITDIDSFDELADEVGYLDVHSSLSKQIAVRILKPPKSATSDSL